MNAALSHEALLLRNLSATARKRPPPGGWLSEVARGRFRAIPASLHWAASAELAHLIDGYDLAEESGLGDCGAFANARRAEAETKAWRGDLLELWLCLFFERRRARHSGYDPEGAELALLDVLCAALVRQARGAAR